VLGLERYDSALPPPETGRFASFACGTLPSTNGATTLLDGPTILATVRRAWVPVDDGLSH
jgi:hypothetical protein